MSLGTLYSNGPLCPFTHRVLIAVSELEAEVDVVYGDDIPADVRDANISGTWPAFVPADGGEMLEDSPEIVDHLVEESGSRGEAYMSDDDVLARLGVLIGCISKVILDGDPSAQEEFRGKLDRAFAEVAKIRAASGGPFLCGDRFTQADGHIAPFLYRLPFIEEIRGHVPPILLNNQDLRAWVDRVVDRESFQRSAPEREALRKFYSGRTT